MSSTEGTLGGGDMSDAESIGECDHPHEEYPFEQYELEEATYLEDLVFRYSEHMLYYEFGLMESKNFETNSIDDVYNQNMYCMSWFYNGCYPFDQWEANYENWLYEQVCSAMFKRDI